MSGHIIESPNLLTTDELARRWGVTPLTVSNWEKAGIIPPSLRISRRKYYRVADIEAYELGQRERSRKLCVKRLTDTAKLPTRGTAGAAGLDLYADCDLLLTPGFWSPVSTGIAVAIPDGYVGLIWPRSGLAVQHGIDVLAGVIDSDYRGEIKAVLINHGPESIRIHPGDRIAQLLIQPVAMFEPVEAKSLPDTERGNGGFGHTGR